MAMNFTIFSNGGAHCILTGFIHFRTILSHEQLTDLSFYLTMKALENQIALNLYCNLTARGKHSLGVSVDFQKDLCIPYEILDSPWTNECHNIFTGIWMDENFSVSHLEDSRMSNVQAFLCDAMEQDWISYMTLQIEDIHGPAEIVYKYTIRAEELCQAISNTPNHINRLEMPAVQFVIKK